MKTTTTSCSQRPESIHEPVSAVQAQALPVWYWNVRSDAELARLRAASAAGGDVPAPARRRGRPMRVDLQSAVPAPWQTYGLDARRGDGDAQGP